MTPRALLAGSLLAAMAALLPISAGADSDEDARARFAAGSAAAAAGDFVAALRAFRAALEAGQVGPAVHYNIGVCAWSLGDLDTAQQAFLATADYPAMAPLAHYNLGLVAQRRGDVGAARRWFQMARDGTVAETELNQLSANALDALEPLSKAQAEERQVAVFVAANAGYDDNVALVADGELIGVSDLDSAYGELQMAALAPIGSDFSLQGGAFVLDYADLPELDQAGAQLELRYRPWLGTWRLELGVGYSLNQLVGERFEDQRSLAVGVTRRLGADWRFRGTVAYRDIEGQPPFEGLAGNRLETRLQLRRYLDRQEWQVEYRFEANDRDDPALSPDRHRLELSWRCALGHRLQLTSGLGWRHSSYDTPGLSRNERRMSAVLGLNGPVTRAWEWVLRYDYARNDASLEEFDYSRSRGYAGVQASF